MPSLPGPIYQWDKAHQFWSFVSVILVCTAGAILLKTPVPLALPAGLLVLLFMIVRPMTFYYLFFFLLPFSIEFELPGGLGTDLPSEQIMWLLLLLTVVFMARKAGSSEARRVYHGITLVICLHLSWILFTVLFSTDPFVSFKFFLAKLWYVLPFYFLPLLMFDSESGYRKVFKFLFTGLILAIIYVMVRHAGSMFAFDTINTAVRPIFRNHVNYAVMLVAFWPFVVYLMAGYKKRSLLLTGAVLLFFLASIYLTYTRAAQIAVLLSVAIYFIIRWRMTLYAIALGVVLLVGVVSYLSFDNKYLDYAPSYEKAIAHKKFDNLVEATYKMEDISTVERFYRWIAGFYMVKERPLTGYGPTTFYDQYRGHTVTSYKTYVSDNPEKSGIHNNYLMVAVEQGIPGLLIMMALAILPLVYGERAYHRLTRRSEKNLLMAAIISFAIIDIVILINDLLEADKVGPLYFLSAAIIVYFHFKSRGVRTERSGQSN